jgi:hypothetical protein
MPRALQKKTPARRHSGWGFQRYRQPHAGGGRYIKATVGSVARHVPVCRGELMSTLTPGRSADSKFICGACPPKETPARRRSGWGLEVSAVAVGRGSRYSQLTLSLVSRHCSDLSQRDRALRPPLQNTQRCALQSPVGGPEPVVLRILVMLRWELNSVSSLRAVRYRKLALASSNRADADLLLKLANECDRGSLCSTEWLSARPYDDARFEWARPTTLRALNEKPPPG